MPDLLHRPCWHCTAAPADISQLDNGLTVIHQLLPSSIATVDVWLAAGAAMDPADYAGMAHFLEHLIFKGTATTQPGEFDTLVESYGGITNAATGYDYAHFYITMAAAQLDRVLPTFADLLLHAAIDPQEFERERQVVLEELRQAKDEPDWAGFQALMTQVYRAGQHPYGRPILGDAEHLEAQSPELLRQFHRYHYRPEKMTLVVSGGISRDRALSLIQQCFSAPKPISTASLDPAPPAPPAALAPHAQSPTATTATTRQVLTRPHLEQARIMMAWLGPGLEDAKTATGLDLLTAILTDGRLSRLVHDLRETRRWVMDIVGDYSCDRLGGLLTLTAWLEPQYLDAVETALQSHMLDLQKHPVGQAELHRAQMQLERDFTFSLETPEDFAELYGHSSISHTLDDVFRYPAWVQTWTPDQLQVLAQQYLVPQQACVTVLQPQD